MIENEPEPSEYESSPLRYDRRERRKELVKACAIVHGVGAYMPLAQLVELILEDGLPPRQERDRMLAEALERAEIDAEGDNT